MSLRSFAIAAWASMIVVLPTAAQSSAAPVDRGATFTFQKEVLYGYGVSSLEDLRGKPVLIEFWSYRCSRCVIDAVPSAVTIKEEYGEDLEVLLAEVGGASDHQMGSFALGQGWLGTGVMWTNERPVTRAEPEIPYFALISAEGELINEGPLNPNKAELEDQIEEQVKAASKAPKPLPRELGAAMLECNQGKFARARKRAQEVADEAGDDGVKRSEAARVLAAISERLDARLRRVRWMLDNGFPIEAEETLKALEKGGVKGWSEPEAQVSALLRELETPQMKIEREAQKALQRVEKKLFRDPDLKWVSHLQKVVEKYPRTKTSERAKQLAKFASI